jgi:hypothetical protein
MVNLSTDGGARAGQRGCRAGGEAHVDWRARAQQGAKEAKTESVFIN